MFTGIVKALGRLTRLDTIGQDWRLLVHAPEGLDWDKIQIGDSLAVNGVCLTVIEKTDHGFYADASKETMQCTNLGQLKPGVLLNLETALTLQTPLGGHLVAGHVDGLAILLDVIPDARSIRYTLQAPEHLMQYIAAKGSVCLDGMSLTINQVDGCKFDVNLIPHTQGMTNAQSWVCGQHINLEVDMIARYLERLCQVGKSSSSTAKPLSMQTLINNGFA